ncbi:KxDL motif-containing protein 1 [Coemansia sp. RSA 2704]|nr:KxDL motif-containing protein 1 [Coemansia sp. RSA 2704]
MSTDTAANDPAAEGSQTTTRTNTALSAAMPGLPALDLSKTLDSQREQVEIYRQLLEILAHSEQASAAIFPELSKSLVAHIDTLSKLKEDLHGVFSRIRALKTHYQSEYPDAFDYVQSLHVKELDDEDDG